MLNNTVPARTGLNGTATRHGIFKKKQVCPKGDGKRQDINADIQQIIRNLRIAKQLPPGKLIGQLNQKSQKQTGGNVDDKIQNRRNAKTIGRLTQTPLFPGRRRGFAAGAVPLAADIRAVNPQAAYSDMGS